jgi:hypothetical protein
VTGGAATTTALQSRFDLREAGATMRRATNPDQLSNRLRRGVDGVTMHVLQRRREAT